MIKIKRSRKVNESDSMYFNNYTYDTVPDVPSIGGIPQYNPMIVDDRIELMDEVIKELEDYWYSEDPNLEDEITRVTSRGEDLYVKDIYWKLENPDVVTVKFGLSGFDGSNDRVAETRDIEINFENFLGRDIEGYLVKFLSSKIKSLLDSVLHGGLYNEEENMIKIKRSRKVNESVGDAQDIYAEANELFYKALSKYRRAKMKAINDGLDYKLLNRLGMLIENFSDAGNKLVNEGAKFFDWPDWNERNR